MHAFALPDGAGVTAAGVVSASATVLSSHRDTRRPNAPCAPERRRVLRPIERGGLMSQAQWLKVNSVELRSAQKRSAYACRRESGRTAMSRTSRRVSASGPGGLLPLAMAFFPRIGGDAAG